jgi:Ankyrin repeats (many copies)/Ankyrin repeat
MAVRLPGRFRSGPYDFDVLQANVDNLVANSGRKDARGALSVFCLRGDTAAATWLADRFALTVHDVRVAGNEALQWTCEGGHLATARWLVDRFGLTVDDARADDNRALRLACYGGHLGVAQWLVNRFGLTVHDMRARGNNALRVACMNNDVTIVRFILAAPPVDLNAPQALARELFLAATRRGFHALAQVLSAHAGLDNAWLAELAAQPQL